MEFPTIDTFMTLKWPEIKPLFEELEDQKLTPGTVEDFLFQWSSLRKLVDEAYARLQLANAQDTTDEEAEARYHGFLADIYPAAESADQRLKEKLLASRLQPEGLDVPLQKMRAEVDLFREENLPLMTRERMLGSEYNKILGQQAVEWQGEELTLVKVRSQLRDPDRNLREKLWRLLSDRQLEDREAVNDIWVKLMGVRERPGQQRRQRGLPGISVAADDPPGLRSGGQPGISGCHPPAGGARSRQGVCALSRKDGSVFRQALGRA